MPTDYEIEKLPGGGVIVWVSEHDPTDRMKGMVGIVLNPGESIFETRVKLSNITPLRHSFLWWENVAVPSNKNYEIFFPHDVSHVFSITNVRLPLIRLQQMRQEYLTVFVMTVQLI